MDGTFIKRVREISWSELLATEQRELFLALREALASGEKFAAEQAEIFGITKPKVHAMTTASTPQSQRRRGRPPKALAASPPPEVITEGDENHPPIRFGGLPREVPGYVSKDGHPDPGQPAELPADHPRNLRARASRAPKVGDTDFKTAEAAIENGQLNELFNPRG